MNAKRVEISSLGQTDAEGSARVSAACRLPEKSRNKLKEGPVKVAADGFICNQDHPEA